jgi:molybdate transport system substrate-binding protein
MRRFGFIGLGLAASAAVVVDSGWLPLADPEGCGGSTVTVYAAASLTEAIRDIAKAYTERTGIRVALSLASSGTLARQIEAGSPADVFLSANCSWMDFLEDRGRVAAGTRTDMAQNTLVLVAPATVGDPPPRKAPREVLAAHSGYVAVGDFESVPAGAYAKQALTRIGCYETRRGSFVEGADVRRVFRLVAIGEASLGIVFLTYALSSPGVEVVAAFPP